MMQSELLLPTSNFPFSTYHTSTPNDQDIDLFGLVDDAFLSSFALLEDLFDNENIQMDIDGTCDWIYSNINHNEGTCSSAEAEEWSPCPSLESSPNMQLNLPGKDMKLDKEVSLTHLLRAYGEAMNDGNNESLTKVIVESINDKTTPQGNAVERVAYHMFKSKDEHGEYLMQESSKNFVTAFNVLYQGLICGRFAHNAANSVILESVPDDATVLHIVDFDIGEGIQWSSLIEALSRNKKRVRITSIKVGENCTSSCWEFEETKKRLHDHAREYGISLQIEEKCIEDFTVEMKRRSKYGGGRDWLVFNCMVALPHMARRRRRRHVVEFLKVAEELLTRFDGIVSLGDGEAGDGLRDCISFESYFGKLLVHYQALFESLECNFPVHLGEARTTLECLFLAPFMCPVAWFEEWNGMTKCLEFESVLDGCKVSRETLDEAKVMMVNERTNSYNVEIQGLRQNEMVLRWKEITLVRISTFCSPK